MFSIEKDLAGLIAALKESFGTRLIYVGLQGSHLRGEAGEGSDVDIMLVLENLQPKDLDSYRLILSHLPWADRACGFVCGREELKCWNRLELLHLLHATKDLYGALKPLVPDYSAEDVRQYILLSVGNLYHELCHRYIYAPLEKSERKLPGFCKAVFFILQDLYWLRTGRFISTKKELLACLNGDDRTVLEFSATLSAETPYDFHGAFSILIRWCQTTLQTM